MTRSSFARILYTLSAGAAFALASCSGGGSSSSNPLADVGDPGLGYRTRIHAIEASQQEVEAGTIDRDAWRESVKKVAWGAANYEKLRVAAIDALLEDDEADTRNMLRLMLPREPSWLVIARIGELAEQRGWEEYTPALVRSWSRPVVQPADDERPERAALMALHPSMEVERVVFDVFAQPSDDKLFGDKQREEAWALLCRLDPSGAKAARYLADLGPTTDPLLEDLQAGASDLHAAPTTPEQLQWLRELRKPEHSAWWSEATRVIGTLNGEQLQGLELRHAAAVVWASQHRPQWLRAGRAELVGELTSRLSSRTTHQRLAEAVEGVRPTREEWSENASKLVWGDALLVLIADDALREDDVIAALYEQVDQDKDDISTEYGGVIDGRGDGFLALSYPPRPAQRIGDNRFVASPELLERGATALFHYHFHARRANESTYAGPGPGDTEYADRFGRSCLVLTSIDEDTLNADYYQPGGAIVDLGEVARP